MSELNIRITDPYLISKLQEIATECEVSISGLAYDMLMTEIAHFEHDSETRVELFRMEQNPKARDNSLIGMKLSPNLQRAFAIACGINDGRTQVTTISLLFGMLSQPYCKAAGLVDSKLSIRELLLDLDARFKIDGFQQSDSENSIRTLHQFLSSEPAPWYPDEERLVFSRANELAQDKHLSTRIMLQAILHSPECTAGRYLTEKGLSYEDFDWIET